MFSRWGYRKLKATDERDEEVRVENDSPGELGPKAKWWSRERYFGSIIFNICTFLLPALYGTLSKLWVAQIDGSMVATTDAYTYIGVFAEVINEGLPRGVFTVIGDRSSRTIQSRINLTYTLLYTQSILGLLLSVIFCSAASSFASTFVPPETRDASLTYVRISSFSTLFSAINAAVGAATRALDRPDIPLAINSVATFVNIILDLALISTVRAPGLNPTANTQAGIRLACDGCGALAGVLYFIFTSKKSLSTTPVSMKTAMKPNFIALKQLVRAGVFTFVESAVRNALYLWLISNIVSMGNTYATAWGVFNTIRWGLIMVPVQALEASAVTFVGHKWGAWRGRVGREVRRAKAGWMDIWKIVQPAIKSFFIVFWIEILLFIILAYTGGVRSFAYYLSNSETAAEVTEMMWKSIEWCYIFYALSTQLATILLATQPRWYLYQSLCSNLLYVLPWCIAVTKIDMNAGNAWLYHRWIFGGSLVVSFGIILVVDGIWAVWLWKGRSEMAPIRDGV
ncbi:hypothetical protein TWF102_010151 [Orbilia oligospora]|uniref:Uncharacterized protein n=1 Tax=Orbilia oligospora TaxID=2813651 RepID=A0A7C8J1V4_ORBOL|nr:hypothetical protein TWF102_010151 [Orbilia oligospora]KAF3093277.1 hypothetical protein TWF103_011031 [Orbilia oligospora]